MRIEQNGLVYCCKVIYKIGMEQILVINRAIRRLNGADNGLSSKKWLGCALSIRGLVIAGIVLFAACIDRLIKIDLY